MAFTPLDTFVFDFTAQSDYPNWTPAQTKTNLNARGEELRVKVNEVVTGLNSGEFATVEDLEAVVLGQIPDGSIAAVKCAADVATQAELDDLAGVGRTTETVKGVSDALAGHQADYMPHQSGLNSYATSVDVNGIYTILSFKRADATLYMKSTLSGGTSPSYTTDTWQFYDALGTTVVLTKTWTITYDAGGKITSKVVA